MPGCTRVEPTVFSTRAADGCRAFVPDQDMLKTMSILIDIEKAECMIQADYDRELGKVREEPAAAMAAAARAEAVALRKYREQQEVEAAARRAAAAAEAAALEARIVAADNAAAGSSLSAHGAAHAAEKAALSRAWERQKTFAARQRGGGAGKKQASAGEWAAVP